MRKQTAYAKTKAHISFAVTAKLISAFLFATRIVKFLYFLNPKFSVSIYLLCLYSPVCVGPVQKPDCWFYLEAAQINQDINDLLLCRVQKQKRNKLPKLSRRCRRICYFLKLALFKSTIPSVLSTG